MNAQRVIALVLLLRVTLRVPLALWIQAISAELQRSGADGGVSFGSFAFAVNLARGLDFVFALCLALAFSLSLDRRWWRVGALSGFAVVILEVASLLLGEMLRGSQILAVTVSLALTAGWLMMQVAATRAIPALVALGVMVMTTWLDQFLPSGALGPPWIGPVVGAIAGLVVAFMAWREPAPAPTR